MISWTKALVSDGEARAKLGMKPDDPGPLKDKKVRAEVAAKNGPIIDEGIKDLDKALQIDPEYDDAMAYENLLYRQKADLEDSSEAYKSRHRQSQRLLPEDHRHPEDQGRPEAHRRRHHGRYQVSTEPRMGTDTHR